MIDYEFMEKVSAKVEAEQAAKEKVEAIKAKEKADILTGIVFGSANLFLILLAGLVEGL